MGSCLWSLGSALYPIIHDISKKILTDNDVDEERAERMVNSGMKIAKAAVITTGNMARGVQFGTEMLASEVCSHLARNYELK